MKKVLLAFSGGLDTTFCAVYLSKVLGYEVHTVLVDTGGFENEEIKWIEQRAISTGSVSHHVLDESLNFYQHVLKYLVFGNVLKNNTYPLSVSAERIYQALAVTGYALELGVEAIAHGSTGAGNDQVRFDLVFQTICPDKEIITPIRDQKLTRQEEIEFLKKHDIAIDQDKSLYSINKGLWGTSVGGKETLTSDKALPEEAFPSQLSVSDGVEVKLYFEEGELKAINGSADDPVNLVRRLNAMGSEFAIGRDIHVGDTIIGIKGRVGFEAPGALMIIKAHHTLEKHVLTKQQLFIKDQLSMWYGDFMHEGKYLEPVMRDIEAFLTSSQASVTGDVYLSLAPYRFSITGIASNFDLMNPDFASYGEVNRNWDGQDVKGFTKLFGNQMTIYQQVHSKDGKN
ncbi:MAG TPA: argininosuccinate synthase [Cyclobacteriaceae bacterium]